MIDFSPFLGDRVARVTSRVRGFFPRVSQVRNSGLNSFTSGNAKPEARLRSEALRCNLTVG